MSTRRCFLKTCSLVSLASLIGCRTLEAPVVVDARGAAEVVDLTFAEQILAGAGIEALIAHPAVDALVCHQEMSGNPAPDRRDIVEGILESRPDSRRTLEVLAQWRDRSPALVAAMGSASVYLPGGSPRPEHLYAVTGYDIGVAAPPDVVLNAGHERFLADPLEGTFYACHEAHHVGFLYHRDWPDVTALGGPGVLAEVVDFITQMEGMAVHAAKPLRECDGAMEADPDYEIYRSAGRAAEVTAAWTALRARCGSNGTDDGGVIGEVLEAMTSGDRLAYMYGALICDRIEKEQGRAALAATVLEPAAFFAGIPAPAGAR